MEITNKRHIITAKEVIEEQEVFYHYEIGTNIPVPMAINFSTEGSDGKVLSGMYSQGGGISLNGNNITQVADIKILNNILTTLLEIMKEEAKS